MRLLFLGTPEFAIPSLEALASSKHEVVEVVTAPDRPRGRGYRVQPTPVAQVAEALGIRVYKTAKLSGDESIAHIESLRPDALVLVAFGQIVPKRLLDLPPYGCINLHPSLLPKYRGAAPIHAPILAGDEVTGVTTMFMDEGLDTGDIIFQVETAIGPEENAGDLHDRLARIGAELLVETIDALERSEAPRRPQDHALATYAKKVESVEIDWNRPAREAANAIRGLSPSPGAYTWHGGRRLKLHRARPLLGEGSPGEPGTVLSVSVEGITVAAGEGAVLLTEVQPEGKAAMSAAEFARGYRVAPGMRLGAS